jgi:hypothetical protein
LIQVWQRGPPGSRRWVCRHEYRHGPRRRNASLPAGQSDRHYSGDSHVRTVQPFAPARTVEPSLPCHGRDAVHAATIGRCRNNQIKTKRALPIRPYRPGARSNNRSICFQKNRSMSVISLPRPRRRRANARPARPVGRRTASTSLSGGRSIAVCPASTFRRAYPPNLGVYQG